MCVCLFLHNHVRNANDKFESDASQQHGWLPFMARLIPHSLLTYLLFVSLIYRNDQSLQM